MTQVDRNGTVLWGNPAFARLCGLPASRLAGQPLSRLCRFRSDDDAEASCHELDLAELEGAGEALLMCPRGAPGQEATTCRPFRITRQPLEDGGQLFEFHDAGETLNLRQQLAEARQRDDLTGLKNRQALIGMLQELHASGRDYVLLLIDIDRFKVINDFYGQGHGDDTLVSLSRYIAEHLGPDDRIGRWSGHEFLCLLPDCPLDRARARADAMRHDARHNFCRDHEGPGQPHTVTVSIGLAARSADDTSYEPLVARADAALYEAKRRGRNRVVTEQEIGKSIFIASAEIESALLEDRLIPAYQPIVELASGKVVADEALARIRGRDGSYLPAGLFIEAASELQLAHRIDQSIASQAIRRCAQQIKATTCDPPVRHFVNISTDLLRHPKRIEAILEVAREAAADCGMECLADKPLVIEITERELVSDPREALEILRPFLDFGLQIAVDDFGSGYSSFLYLLDLPVTYLKIEGELVKRMQHDRKARAIIQGIQSIADQLGLTTIAEFIEDEETARILADLGVHWGQGYLFGRPQIETS